MTERHVRNLDNMIAHGINCLGVYIQGSNGGWPDVNAGRDGYTPEGNLRPEFARRLEWLIREADQHGMVVLVGLLSPRKDRDLKYEQAIRQAVRQTAKFLSERKLKNVFVDLMHEYNAVRITSRFDHDIMHEPNGAEKKARLTHWFKEFAPDIPVGIYSTGKPGRPTSILVWTSASFRKEQTFRIGDLSSMSKRYERTRTTKTESSPRKRKNG